PLGTKRGVLLVDHGVPGGCPALLLDPRLHVDVVALVIGGEAALHQYAVRERRTDLYFTGRVNWRIPGLRRRRWIEAGHHRRSAILQNPVVVGRQLRLLVDLPDDARLEAVDALLVHALLGARRRRVVGRRRTRDRDDRVSRQRVEMERAGGPEKPNLVLLDRPPNRAFDVREPANPVRLGQTSRLQVGRQVVALKALVLKPR